MNVHKVSLVAVVVWLAAVCISNAQMPKPKPIFQSDVITTATQNHAVKVDVDVRNLKQLFLVADDGGNGFSHDWASWGDAQLVGPGGKKWLSELKPIAASSGYGDVRMNRNCEGQGIRIDGRGFEHGIGTHANSIVGFDLPAGFERFQATAGLDEGGTRQAGGENASVRFLIYSVSPGPVGVASEDHDPKTAVEKLDVADGLQATLFASEPKLLSLTNLDVDHLGRVWVCEVVNYRGHNGERPEGDRILICSDTDGDGVCDEAKVYYQGRDVDSAMGICVLGNKVIVSCSPNIWVFTDDDGDDIPDRKELLFSKTGSSQHDHSAHSFVFGPDGKLYWNFGNEGHAVYDPNGNLVKDLRGNEVNDRGAPYRGGMVFRCNLDGSDLEVLGHNFRNNYEVAVDSFGGLWQSDNDDDGNRGVRINFVMEYGNYGYLDERTGAGWQSPRTGMESEIPKRHWHQDDPGVIPNLLVTGAGSPTGITIYEGDLLPAKFHGQPIHCDAGPNIVRSYAVAAQGAGYEVKEVNNLLLGARDNWFRPADACVAPDGSVLVTDWYDPGVGGHGMRDVERGRLFRIAPPGSKYQTPAFNFLKPESAVEALKNPCQSVRYLAYMALKQLGGQAAAELTKMASDPNSRFRARALWLLSEIDGNRSQAIARAANDADENIRCQAVRMARRETKTLGAWLAKWTNDSSPAVRREVAIALHEYNGVDTGELWAKLAHRFDGQDRWYLEALGIAADGRWNECLSAWLKLVGDDWQNASGVQLIWRSRADRTSELLAQLIANPATDDATATRLFRAMEFQDSEKSVAAIPWLAERAEQLATEGHSLADTTLVEIAVRQPEFLKLKLPTIQRSVVEYLNEKSPENEFVERAARLRSPDFEPRLLTIVLQSGNRNVVSTATRVLIDMNAKDALQQRLDGNVEPEQLAVIQALKGSGHAIAREMLQASFESADSSTLVRSEIIKALGQWPEGQRFVLKQAASGALADELKFPAANVLLTSSDAGIREEAAKYLVLPTSAGNLPLPPMSELIRKRGDKSRGLDVFVNAGTCAKCHKVNGTGTEVGPDLSEIGGKLSLEAMYESILNPSAGISHNYEMYTVLTSDGRTLSGVLVSKTDNEVVLKDKEAVLQIISTEDIDDLKKQTKSLMPDDLQKQLTEQQLIDVVEYLQTLKKK